MLWEVFSLGIMPYTGCANREVMQMVTGGGRLDIPHGETNLFRNIELEINFIAN